MSDFVHALRGPSPIPVGQGVLRVGAAVRSGLVEAWVCDAVGRLRGMLSEMAGAEWAGVWRLESPPPVPGGDERRLAHLTEPLPGSTLAEAALDVLLVLGEGLPPPAISPRLGVWAFVYGDPSRGSTAYFREVFNEEPVSVIALIRIGPDSAELIETHCAATVPGRHWELNARTPLRMAVEMAARRLCDLHQWGAGAVRGTRIELSPSRIRTPGPWTMARFALRQLARTWRLRREARGRELEWIVCERRDGGPWREISVPPGHQIADPFLVESQTGRYLFVEETPRGTRKGRLAVLTEQNGRWSSPEVIVETGTHTSYPLVFQDGGEWWMIPETSAADEVALWRAVEFPYRWQRDKLLARGPWKDTTPHWHDGRWYFFTTRTKPGIETYLFSSDRLDGEWRYHPANPVSTDVRRARCAGKIFARAGRLVRPAQDCSVRYGYAMVLNEIRRLSESEYEEAPGEWIGPDWYPGLRATHTISEGAGIEIRDGSRFRRPARTA